MVHRSETAPPPRLESSGREDDELEIDTTIVSEAESADTPTGILSPPSSVLRRSKSSIDATDGHRITKHLRFTAVGDAASLRAIDNKVVYPGGARRRKRNVPRDQEWLLSGPPTPNLSETADQIRRTISLASLDHLLLLRHDQEERARVVSELSRAGRGLVWRSQDDKQQYPDDAERSLILALKRGLRSFILAFSVRAGVNVLIVLFRILKAGKRGKGRVTLKTLRMAIFGEEPLRFGAMIGTFTFLNCLTLHLLRLRYGFSQPTFGPPQREGNEGERRWQAAAAGAVGSLGLLWETAGRRTGIAQQMFVRGLQGTYNQYAPQMGLSIPHGDILLFGLCCGQIMYAFLLAPETLSREYYNWIQSASGVPKYAIGANRTAVRNNFIAPAQLQKALAEPRGVTPRHARTIRAMLEDQAKGGRPGWHIPCAVLHPWMDSCIMCDVERFFQVFRFMLPVYGALHLIPPLVLRRHHFQKDPLRMLAKILLGIVRSCSFLGFFVCINQALFCMRSRTLDMPNIPDFLRRVLNRKENLWVMGFLDAGSLFAEEKRRRAELAMYVLPKALESAWFAARRRSYVPLVPFGETILGAAAMAMVMDTYKHSPESLSGIVRKLMFQLVGPV
ncbi:hypothetical protein CspHIS471_0609740 [Cutaneotrichosporon sp. HIS471]|nr:hypothetical protein CspHIS471_0609740 [Cutaneotrichosporon sp. HIS471]